jgi:hypothetical protein
MPAGAMTSQPSPCGRDVSRSWHRKLGDSQRGVKRFQRVGCGLLCKVAHYPASMYPRRRICYHSQFMPPAHLVALEEAKDRILAALEQRSDLAGETRESLRSQTKELYYTMVAASDLLRAEPVDAVTSNLVRPLLDSADYAAAELASDLGALGAEGKRLEEVLETAVRACRDSLVARLR